MEKWKKSQKVGGWTPCISYFFSPIFVQLRSKPHGNKRCTVPGLRGTTSTSLAGDHRATAATTTEASAATSAPLAEATATSESTATASTETL